MKVWVTRDKDNRGLCSCFMLEPYIVSGEGFWNEIEEGNVIVDIPPKRFKKAFGFTPSKGSCKQMNLTLTKIK